MNKSSAPQDPTPAEVASGIGIMPRLRNYFLTGLVIAAPLAITVYIVWWMVHWIDGWVKPLIPTRYDPEQYLPFAIPGLGVMLAIILITLLGFFTANLLGRSLVTYGEGLLGRMPLVRTIYSGLKQMFVTMITDKSATFNNVVLIEYPRRHLWSLAFVSAPVKGELFEILHESDKHEDEVVSVYVPTTPNPTSGYLLFCKRSEMIELDMSIEDAAKLVITAGLVTPEYHKYIKRPADKARVRRKPERVG
ncbi:MAG TPA: DUF502 domain-containing protein [Xanthobacteraceae bacterium]|nr:DUF502 domain-containing protein [Xanthobacteraceae bacterium]